MAQKYYEIILDRYLKLSDKMVILHPVLKRIHAQVAELVDALVSNTCGFTPVPVRLRSWAPTL